MERGIKLCWESDEKKMNAREVAIEILLHWEKEKTPIHLLLRKNLEKLSKQEEKALCKVMVYGVIEYLDTLDAYVDSFAKKKSKISQIARNILRLATYQKYFMNDIPDYAIANEMVSLCKKKTHRGNVAFVNAVIRRILETPLILPEITDWTAEELSQRYNYPLWMVFGWIEEYGIEETQKILEHFENKSKLFLRTNTAKISRRELLKLLEEEGVQAEPFLFSEEAILCQKIEGTLLNRYFHAGYFSIQDISSMLVADLIQLQEQDIFLDMCCAPGGKLSHIGTRYPTHSYLYGYDKTDYKIKLVKESMERLGLNNITVEVFDSRKLWEKWEEKATCILLDAPCSGTGVIGKKPDIKWARKKEDVLELVAIQKQLLESAYRCLQSGGLLIYSTCSMEPEENRLQYESFLERHKDMKRVSLKGKMKIPIEDDKGYVQILPSMYGTDGFFISLLKKD